MKAHYTLFLLCAVFITALADGISLALTPIPVIGIILAFAITSCINITMGAGLIILLMSCDMYHPRISPFAIIGGLIPGLNFLPFWVGLVVAGIVYKMNAEGEDLGAIGNTALKLQSTYLSNKSPFQKMREAGGIVMNERRATGRPPQAEAQSESQPEAERAPHTLPGLKSPNLAPKMNGDIVMHHNAPPRAANDNNQLHAQAA